MGDVSVIGLGAMGSALARAFLRSGRTVCVWNRTPAKAEPLVAEGADLAGSVNAAVQASPAVVVCVGDYAASASLFESLEVRTSLAGATLVQLGSGTPEGARTNERWASELGARYLDGSILAYPRQIGTPEATVVLSGSAAAYDEHAELLRALTPKVMFLGETVGVAAAIECAQGAFLFGTLLGFVHGALVCEAEGIPLAGFASVLRELVPAAVEEVQHHAEVIAAQRYDEPEAALATYAGGAAMMLQHAHEAELSRDFPALVVSLLDRAVAAGRGGQEVSALIEVLRRHE